MAKIAENETNLLFAEDLPNNDIQQRLYYLMICLLKELYLFDKISIDENSPGFQAILVLKIKNKICRGTSPFTKVWHATVIRSCRLKQRQYCQTWNNFPPDCVTSSLFVVDEDEGDEEENWKGRISCLSVSPSTTFGSMNQTPRALGSRGLVKQNSLV